MLFKWLVVGGIIYFIYRYFIRRPAIEEQSQKQPTETQEDDGEFIDYEEVD